MTAAEFCCAAAIRDLIISTCCLVIVCGNNNVVEDFLVNIGPVIEISTKITTGNIYTKHIHVGVGSNTSGDVFGRGGLFIQLLPAGGIGR